VTFRPAMVKVPFRVGPVFAPMVNVQVSVPSSGSRPARGCCATGTPERCDSSRARWHVRRAYRVMPIGSGAPEGRRRVRG